MKNLSNSRKVVYSTSTVGERRRQSRIAGMNRVAKAPGPWLSFSEEGEDR